MSHSTVRTEAVEALAMELEAYGARRCTLAMVLGSGLGALGAEIKNPIILDASVLMHLPGSTVEGHAGRIVLGELYGVQVLVQEGRIHLYEGWDALVVTRAVRAFALLGIRAVVLTNAAGCMQRQWSPGGFMRITDQINLQGVSPLLGNEASTGTIYCPILGALVDAAAKELNMELHRGIYAGLLGPSYETPAEIRMLRWLGAQAVGMSTVAEASAARAMGMQVVGLSCLTNYAAGIEEQALSHVDVVRAGLEASDTFIDLCRQALPKLQARLR